MQGVFEGADGISVVLPVSQAVAPSELRGLAALLVNEAYELEVELGSPVRVCDPPCADVPRLELIIDRDVRLPRLSLDHDGCVLAAVAPDVDGVVESLSLIRTLRTRGVSNVTAGPAADTESAAERLAHEVASTFPGFGLRDVEWSKLVDRYMSRLDDHNPVPTFERWVAELGDAHTRVRRGGPVAALPYTARVASGSIVLDEVQDGTAGFDAGVRRGDVVVGVDVADLWERTGAPAHLRPWVVGRRALSGPVGELVRVAAKRSDGSTVEWSELATLDPWTLPVDAHRLASGTAYLRIRRWWSPHDEDNLDAAFDGFSGAERLIVDLRGNVGGNLVAATSFRDRFVPHDAVLGTIRFSNGDGSLSRPAAIDARPSDGSSWHRPVKFITDALTYSASEDAILGLQQFPHVRVVGQPSGGGSGRPRTIRLLDDTTLSVSTALTYDHTGRCIENAGVQIDETLPTSSAAPTVRLADERW